MKRDEYNPTTVVTISFIYNIIVFFIILLFIEEFDISKVQTTYIVLKKT